MQNFDHFVSDFIIRSAVPVVTVALLSSIPAAGQTKLSTQQLNSPTLNVNKPIAAPKAYSPNLNKPITTAPITVQRPVPDNNPRPMAHGSIKSGTIAQRSSVQVRGAKPVPNAFPSDQGNELPLGSQGSGVSFGPLAPCPSGTPRDRNGGC
jgi:hypothetical protein